MKNEYSLKELCDIIGISLETGRNWERLTKISPDINDKYSKKYVELLLKELSSDNNKVLKNRRNKRYVTGRKINSSYIESVSGNQTEVIKFINLIEKSDIVISDRIVEEVCILIAKKLVCQSVLGENNKLDLEIKNSKATLRLRNIIDTCNFRYIKNEDTLGLLYQSLNNLKNRKARGAYYTPTNIVSKLINQVFCDIDKAESITICDPCCGTGNFLLQLPEDIIFEQIYGNDIDEMAVKLARINLAMKYGITDKELLEEHITCKNFFYSEAKSFDIYIGNPPWGCEFTKKDNEYFKKNFECAKRRNTEAFDLAVEKAVKNLCDGGKVAFVLPEAILNVRSHKEIREFIIRECQISSISYVGNVFEGVQAPSVLISLKKDRKSFSTIGMQIENKEKHFEIKVERNISADYFDFYANDAEYEIINRIYNSKAVEFLKNQAVFGLGIVSGANADLISNKKTTDSEIILKGTDIYPYVYEESNNYIHFVPEKFQQVAPTWIYRADEKLLYKFINDRLVFAYDDKKHITLNSCNVVIPKIPDMNIKYIMAVLNSDMAQFIFKKKFNSVKVLRSHLEEIPIPRLPKKEEEEIVGLVDKIINENDSLAIKTVNERINLIYQSIK